MWYYRNANFDYHLLHDICQFKRYPYKFFVEGIAHSRMERKGYSKWFWIENDKAYSLEAFFIQNDALYAFLWHFAFQPQMPEGSNFAIHCRRSPSPTFINTYITGNVALPQYNTRSYIWHVIWISTQKCANAPYRVIYIQVQN